MASNQLLLLLPGIRCEPVDSRSILFCLFLTQTNGGSTTFRDPLFFCCLIFLLFQLNVSYPVPLLDSVRRRQIGRSSARDCKYRQTRRRYCDVHTVGDDLRRAIRRG